MCLKETKRLESQCVNIYILFYLWLFGSEFAMGRIRARGPGGPKPTRNLTDNLTLFKPGGWQIMPLTLLPVPRIQKAIYSSALLIHNLFCDTSRVRKILRHRSWLKKISHNFEFLHFFFTISCSHFNGKNIKILKGQVTE